MTQSTSNQTKHGGALGKFMLFVQLLLKMIGQDEWHKRPVAKGMDQQAVSANLNLIKNHLMRGGSSETHAPYVRVVQQRSTQPEDIEVMVTGYLDAVAKLNLFLQSTSVTTADLLSAFKSWHVSVTRRLFAGEYRSELSNGREVATLLDDLLKQNINGRNVYKVVGNLYYELHKLHPFEGGGNHRAIMLLVNYVLIKNDKTPFYLKPINFSSYKSLTANIRSEQGGSAIKAELAEYFRKNCPDSR